MNRKQRRLADKFARLPLPADQQQIHQRIPEITATDAAAVDAFMSKLGAEALTEICRQTDISVEMFLGDSRAARENRARLVSEVQRTQQRRR
jgi:hypothetical protein